MVAIFEGVREPLDYDTPGALGLPCLAATLSMLGVGRIEDIQDSLLDAGISALDGISEIPEEGFSYEGNGKLVTVEPPTWHIKLPDMIDEAGELLANGQALMPMVKLHEDLPEDYAMHFTLIFGHDIDKTSEPHAVVRTYVGDSRFDATEARLPTDVLDMLERTLKATGVLIVYPVKVEDAQGASRQTSPLDIVRLPGGGETIHRD